MARRDLGVPGASETLEAVRAGPLTALATTLDLDVDALVTEAEKVFKETVDN